MNLSSGIAFNALRLEQVDDAKLVILTVAAGIFAPHDPPQAFINRWWQLLTDVDGFAEAYALPDGLFLVATDDGRVIGTGALRRLDEQTAELKRMWLLEAYQGRGIGYGLFQSLVEFGRAAGYQRVRLTASDRSTRALAFYRRVGFRTIDLPRVDDDDVSMELEWGQFDD